MIDLTSEIIEQLNKKYDVLLENPWERYPGYTTAKERMSEKWFALFMRVSGDKLGLDTTEEIPIVNVKADKEVISFVSGARGVFPAYHMNKAHWLSIAMDGTLRIEEVMHYIDSSYQMIVNTPTRRIYEAVKRIPRGRVATYGQVAAMAGNPKMSRAVGNALHKNPDEDAIPCYRVVNSKGETSEAFVFGGRDIQAERLTADGIEVVDGRVDLKKYGINLEEIHE